GVVSAEPLAEDEVRDRTSLFVAVGAPLAWMRSPPGCGHTAILGAPLAAAAGILTYRWRTASDAPETDVARSSDEWIAAVRSELAAVEDPRERRHFARAVVVVVVVRRTLTAWTWLLAGCVAAAVTVLSAVAS